MHSFFTGFRRLLTGLVLCALLGAGCGGSDGGEVVYLHVFHGYPGAQSLSLYGPSGPVVTDLQFGERTDEPVRVDRNLGSEFTLVLDGAPETFNLTQDLYLLYPQETATFFVSSRQDTSATVKVFRHVQSIASACRLIIDNSLAVESDDIGLFDFLAGWEFADDPTLAGYSESAESSLPSDDQRPELYDAIDEHPYFILTEQDEEEATENPDQPTFAWIGPEDRIGPPRVDFEAGSILAPLPTAQYIMCLEEAEAAQAAIDGGDSGEVDPELVATAEQDCTAPQSYGTQMYSPGGAETTTQRIHYYPEGIGNTGDSCDVSLRIFSDFDNIFSGEHGNDDYTNNVRVDINAEYTTSDHFFFILYGRPVNPMIESWTATDPATGGGFEDIDEDL